MKDMTACGNLLRGIFNITVTPLTTTVKSTTASLAVNIERVIGRAIMRSIRRIYSKFPALYLEDSAAIFR